MLLKEGLLIYFLFIIYKKIHKKETSLFIIKNILKVMLIFVFCNNKL